jgi:hypothetical protein
MKYLVLDNQLIEKTENVRLKLGSVEKEPRSPLLVEDKPWEIRFDNMYPNVIYDTDDRIFKMWYDPFIVDDAVTKTPLEKRKEIRYHETPTREMGICYATSKDGIVWEKPELGLVEYEGSKRNNLVKRPTHGAGIEKDLHDPDPARRYKMLTCREDQWARNDLMAVAFSPDGLRWLPYVPCPGIQAKGDTHNNFFWSEKLKKYVGLTRLWDQVQGQRLVGRTESPDFLDWTKAEEIMRAPADTLHRQTYELLGFPYAQGCLGFVAVLDTQSDCVDVELAWSSDTIHWQRICPGTGLIPRGSAGRFDCGCIYTAKPIIRDNKIYLYYSGGNDTHMSWRATGLGLAYLRMDGFAGYEPVEKEKTGTMVTTPVVCDGTGLTITADAAGGSLRVGILHAEGFSPDVCEPITAEGTDVKVVWRGGKLDSLKGKSIRLLFELKNARLYSFTFSGV